MVRWEKVAVVLILVAVALLLALTALLADMTVAPQRWHGVLLSPSVDELSSAGTPIRPTSQQAWSKYANPSRDFGISFIDVNVALDDGATVEGWYAEPPESSEARHLREANHKKEILLQEDRRRRQLENDATSGVDEIRDNAATQLAVDKMLSGIGRCPGCDMPPPLVYDVGVVMVASRDRREMEPIMPGIVRSGFPVFVFKASADSQVCDGLVCGGRQEWASC